MFYFDYPKVKSSLGRAALEDPYPAWLLDTRGVIRAANLMAFWLWDTLKPREPIRPNTLLNTSDLDIFANNFERIPVEQNSEFYAKKSLVAKRMNAEMGAALCASFITAMKSDPRLAQIYEEATPYIDREWEYSLRIIPPGLRGSDDTRLLEFQVTVYRLEADSGFLCTYTPTRASVPAIEEQYSLLIDQFGDKGYIQTDDTEQDNVMGNQLSTSILYSFHAYYPTFILDPLWYIIDENQANQLLVGQSSVGKHFFELFFAPQLREWLGPLQETSAPRAIRYFDVFTTGFLRENHELHAGYEQTMKHLLQLQDFGNLLEVSRKLSIRLNIPDNPETPFYMYRDFLPWPLSHEVTLQFRYMAHFINQGSSVNADKRDYQITLVPENYETEIALILSHIFAVERGSSIRLFSKMKEKVGASSSLEELSNERSQLQAFFAALSQFKTLEQQSNEPIKVEGTAIGLIESQQPGSEHEILSLYAIARAVLEEDNRAFVGKIYTVQAGISRNKPESFRGEAFDPPLVDSDEAIPFDVLLHSSENVELIAQWRKHLTYAPRNAEIQLVEFPFRVRAPGNSFLVVDFYREHCWVKTIRLEFDAIELSSLTTASSVE